MTLRVRWAAGIIPLLAMLLTVGSGVGATAASASGSSFVAGLSTISTVASTVPANGDVNPYGTVVVPRSVGKLRAGSVLVSNFNNRKNLQGTGKTIVEISPSGNRTVFASIHLADNQVCPGGVGLTTALAVFGSGWVVVGSLPTSDGSIATARAGCLIVLDPDGHVAETIHGGPINGPWDMTGVDLGSTGVLFVTNVLNGTVAADPNPMVPGQVVNRGTVVRLTLDFHGQAPAVRDERVIASGFAERGDPAALVVGPTGVGLGRTGLYVADTASNRITLLPAALFLPGPVVGSGIPVTAGGSLNAPLGLTIAPNGDVLTVNGDDGNLVETTPSGMQVATVALDSTPEQGSSAGAGALFGLAVAPGGNSLYFVDDIANTLNLLS